MVLYQEINEYLLHNDYSLANRKMLDAAYATKNPKLIQEAITISQLKSAKHMEDWRKQLDIFIVQLQEHEAIAVPKLDLLTIDGISKAYKNSGFALSPISLAVKSGDIIGLVGENGNGKTTLLRCIAKELAVDAGDIHYHFLKKYDNYDIKNAIAFIPQRIPRWYGLLKDNLHFSAAIQGKKGKENEMMVDFMLERFGITQYANLTWNQISSGYRTRFEIARILLQSPQLLILDEPLANLDINAQQTLLTDLKMLAKSSYLQMGIILSSQQLHEVEKVADNVLYLKEGKHIINTLDIAAQQIYTAIIELECVSSREILQQIFAEEVIKYNGNFYTIYSKRYTPITIAQLLTTHQIEFNYFRNISQSTKQYFNS